MRIYILFLIATFSISTLFANDLNETIKSATEDFNNAGNPPSISDCECDKEDLNENQNRKQPKKVKPLISFSFGVEADGNGNKSVTSYDCDKSTRKPEMQQIINVLPTLGREEFKQYISEHTQDFSDEDKICLANEFGILGNQNYDLSKGIGTYSLDEMHSCIQQSAQGNWESCRTCAPIHHYTADMIESMGGQCGLVVNQDVAPDVDLSTMSYTGTESRFMHYVNICKLNGKFHLINYSRNYQLEAMSYQEAIDIANIGLAEGNWAGNQITCMDSGKSSLKECKHVYLSRSTRYQLHKIKEAIAQIDDASAPISVELTNLTQAITFAVPINKKTETKKQKDGDLVEKSITQGLTAGMEIYRAEIFGQSGYVRKSKTIVSEEENPEEAKRTSTQDLYIGVIGSSGDGAFKIDDGKQSYTSLLGYLKREDQYHLNQKNDFIMQYDAVIGSDVANITRPGENAGLGQTNVVTAKWKHQFGPKLTSEISQQFSLMTDRANLPMPQIGQTTLTLNQDYLPHIDNIDLINSSSLHLLHGGLSDETLAFQNKTEISTRNVGPTHLSLNINSDIGYTTQSVTGRDIFYDQGIWANSNIGLVQPVKGKHGNIVYVRIDGGIRTGSRPSQFGIDPLTIELNPTRNSATQVLNGSIKLEGQF